MLTPLLLLAAPRPADACSIVVPGSFAVDPVLEGTETTPPTLDLSDARAHTSRGVGPTCVSGGYASTSCDDIGSINLSFPSAGAPAPEGDLDSVGYLLRVVEGTVPDGFWLDTAPYAAFHHDGDATIPLIWIDGAEEAQEAFSFTLGVTPIDSAGNTGGEELLFIDDPGNTGDGSCASEALGCAHRSGGGGGWLLLLAAALLRGRSQAASARRGSSPPALTPRRRSDPPPTGSPS